MNPQHFTEARCQRCHRPMKPTESGLGPVCAKRAKPIPDLFSSAEERVAAHLDRFVAVQLAQMRALAAAARGRMAA